MILDLQSPAVSAQETERCVSELLCEFLASFLNGLTLPGGRRYEPAALHVGQTAPGHQRRTWRASGTDAQVSAPGHGYWMAQRIVLPGPAQGEVAPPAPLVAGTAYYVQPLTADTFMLHASEAHALANTSPIVLSATTGYVHWLPVVHLVFTRWRHVAEDWVTAVPNETVTPVPISAQRSMRVTKSVMVTFFVTGTSAGDDAQRVDHVCRRLASQVQELIESGDESHALARKGITLKLKTGPVTAPLSGADTRKDVDGAQVRVLVAEATVRYRVAR